MGVLSGKRMYLSGPIEYCNAENWRPAVVDVLAKEFGINVFDPFSDPKQQWVEPLKEAQGRRDFDAMSEIARRFVRKDLCMVDRSDFLIAHIPYRIPTTGTHHEIINSSNAKKPTILVCPQGKEFVPLWYYGFIPHQMMFGSWKDVYAYLREVEDGKHVDNDRWSYIYGLV